MKNHLNLSIVVVTWNAAGYLENFIKSIYKQTKKISFEIWVVDNNSQDKTVELMRTKFPQIKIIANFNNPGFSRANNQAIKKARGEYTLTLNPDMLIKNRAIEKSYFFLKNHHNFGAVGVRLVDKDNKLQITSAREFPTIWGELCFYLHLFRTPLGKTKIFGSYIMSYWDHADRREIEAITGAYIMAKTKLWQKLRGFDESFFMYGEDLDICYRINKLGYKIMYLGNIEVIHFGGKSSGYSLESAFRSGIAQIEALYHYFKKNRSPLYAQVYKFMARTLALLDYFRRVILSILPKYRYDPKTIVGKKIDKKIINWDLNYNK